MEFALISMGMTHWGTYSLEEVTRISFLVGYIREGSLLANVIQLDHAHRGLLTTIWCDESW